MGIAEKRVLSCTATGLTGMVCLHTLPTMKNPVAVGVSP